MADLVKFGKDRQRLLHWYDRVGDTPLLHDDEVTIQALNERREGLLTERFVVAVCGQMKAGKSTALNALLFGASILPMSVTTMTAKITLISSAGDADPSISVTFYDSDEWPRIVDAIRTNQYSWEEFEEALELAAQGGVWSDELIQRPAKRIEVPGLDSLDQFVAVPDDGGLYSPFVKSVELKASDPWLGSVVVADTPGVNDPNKDREALTKKWVLQADAVVYLTYAGQAGMTQDDVEFIDENLLHIPANRRIIAVNKIDLVQDPSQVLSHLDDLRQSSVRMRSLLGDEDSIILCSALGALIDRALSERRELEEID